MARKSRSGEVDAWLVTTLIQRLTDELERLDGAPPALDRLSEITGIHKTVISTARRHGRLGAKPFNDLVEALRKWSALEPFELASVATRGARRKAEDDEALVLTQSDYIDLARGRFERARESQAEVITFTSFMPPEVNNGDLKDVLLAALGAHAQVVYSVMPGGAELLDPISTWRHDIAPDTRLRNLIRVGETDEINAPGVNYVLLRFHEPDGAEATIEVQADAETYLVSRPGPQLAVMLDGISKRDADRWG